MTYQLVLEIKMQIISIIVPVYNVEAYLPRCIESILEQTFTEWELLLINDGSTDRSGSICDEYAQSRRIRGLRLFTSRTVEFQVQET